MQQAVRGLGRRWRSLAAAGGAAALTALAAGGAAAQQQGEPYYGYGYGRHMMDGGWFGWIAGPIMMILFIAVAVGAVVLVVRWLGGGPAGGGAGAGTPQGRTALDILKERYARGEIDKEEFEERRRVLGD